MSLSAMGQLYHRYRDHGDVLFVAITHRYTVGRLDNPSNSDAHPAFRRYGQSPMLMV